LDNIAGIVSLVIGVVTGLTVLIWSIVENTDLSGIGLGLFLGFVIGRIVVFIAVLPSMAIARLIYLFTK